MSSTTSGSGVDVVVVGPSLELCTATPLELMDDVVVRMLPWHS